MFDLLELLIGPLGGVLAAIAAIAGALVWGRRTGAQSERQKREAQDAQDYRATRERIDDALRRNDGSDSRDWLRERGDKR